ncbi:hypothetical protein DXG01_013779, partial [Tephrocybe rancida]
SSTSWAPKAGVGQRRRMCPYAPRCSWSQGTGGRERRVGVVKTEKRRLEGMGRSVLGEGGARWGRGKR